MKREKEFEINGCVSVPEDLSYDDFWDKFIDFIEANNWSFGGGINEIVDGFYINEDRTNGDHVLDQDLKELIYQGNNKRAVDIYMDLTGSNKKEAQEYVAGFCKRLWGNSFRKLTRFLNKLEDNKIFYKLDSVRNDYIMVEVAIPGQRWEVEFSPDGDVVVERFKSFEDVGDENILDYLFENFSD